MIQFLWVLLFVIGLPLYPYWNILFKISPKFGEIIDWCFPCINGTGMLTFGALNGFISLVGMCLCFAYFDPFWVIFGIVLFIIVGRLIDRFLP